jgi:hypothetical protein
MMMILELGTAEAVPYSEEIAVVQAFRPAVSGGPKGPHYIRSDFFTGSSAAPINGNKRSLV